MTETNRYNNGKIYKLVSPHSKNIYVGSTCKERLCQRLASHKSKYKFWVKDNNNGYNTSFILFDLGDVEIILLESVNCLTKDELLKKEREWIDKYKDIIVNNQLRPLITKEEKTEYLKQYQEKNVDLIKDKKKKYYDDNKEYFLVKRKEYEKEHKEKIKQYRKEYDEKNKEKLNKRKEQIQCDCGLSFQKMSKSRHTKTQTHQQYINSLVSKSVLKT